MKDAQSELRQLQARLARTRLALVAQMRRHGPAPRDEGGPSEADPDQGRAGLAAVLRRWWQGHPVRLALEVGAPLAQTLVQTRPLPVMALCIALGAALVWLRPWRLLPLSALLVSTARSMPLGDLLAAWRAQAKNQERSPQTAKAAGPGEPEANIRPTGP